ncbi:MAG TPA: TonB-dependent receptor [Candidatus Krumholzibacteria bacterium]|nr:TonB-dependent receptor [Candidatus Krumholzibacteria bacterium]HPD71343.1 TonB-dependent receptor [Candidatus Krumholzibacteria bacterium]HRY38957.1 TonB-dependent receptor [Candidatus Krumholzibacteria bacterium]
MLRRLRQEWIVLGSSIILAACLGSAGDVWAQAAPGTIKGIVKDGETGDLLDYANVIIKGTTRGTMSLGGGSFYFRGLAPGVYTIQVLYLGYEPKEITVNLQPGQTVDLDFTLKVTIVETLQAFDVDAARYMVEVKGATSTRDIGSEKFERFAIDSVDEALAREAGIIMRAGQLYVRGGRSGEVQTQIDGVSVDNPIGGQTLSVSTLAVESVEAVTGGLDAEYGNALSGVINITTKTGSREKFEGGLRFLTDDFGRQDRTFTNFDRFEYGFGGPSPVDNLTYYVSGDLSWTDGENYSVANRPEYDLNVGDTNLLSFRRRQSNTVRGSAKLAYFFDESGTKELTAEYTYSGGWNQSYSPNWSVNGYAQRLVYMPYIVPMTSGEDQDAWLYTGRQIPVYYGPWYETMLRDSRPAIVMEIRNSSFIRQTVPILQVRSAADNRMYWVAAQPLFDGYRYPYSGFSTVAEDSSYTAFNAADNNLEASTFSQSAKLFWKHRLDESTFYTLAFALVAFDTRQDVNGQDPFAYNHGGVWSPDLFSGQASIYQGGSDYYSDELNPLFITTSDYPFWAEQYSRTYSARFDLTSARWEGHLVRTGLQLIYNDLQELDISSPARETVNRFTGEYSLGTNRNEFHTYNPEASWYLQDRWEYEGMVVNYGFRWDMFSPGSAAEIQLRNEDVDRNVLKYKTQFSPRLGFAFPITERDGFSFHYGRFVQFPGREFLFASQEVVGNLGTLGNPNLEAETTISYQAAIQHQFNDYLGGSFAIYSKDIYDLIAATQVTDEETGNTLARYINKAYASARGMEISLEKRLSNHWHLDTAYTFAYADGVASSTEFGGSPEGLEFLPSQELPLAWDQRHTVSVQLFLEQQGWNGGIDVTYGSGFPWTPVDRYAKRQDPLLENSERLPSTIDVNLQFQRQIDVYGQRLTLYLQGFNILNQDQVVSTSPGIFPGMNNAANAGQSYLTETGKFGGAYLQDQDGDTFAEFIPIKDPRAFAQHRLFRVGLGWRF